MKKVLLLLWLFTLSVNVFCQTKTDIVVKKIKVFVLNNSAAPKNFRTVYYNKADKIIEIGGIQIPISNVTTSYKHDETVWEYASHYMVFACKYPQRCVTGPNGEPMDGIGVSFKSKQNCYDFVNLINELRDTH